MVIKSQEAYDLDAAVAALHLAELIDAIYPRYHEKELHPAARASLQNYRSKRAKCRTRHVADHLPRGTECAINSIPSSASPPH